VISSDHDLPPWNFLVLYVKKISPPSWQRYF
jgi:hypothetical protein